MNSTAINDETILFLVDSFTNESLSNLLASTDLNASLMNINLSMDNISQHISIDKQIEYNREPLLPIIIVSVCYVIIMIAGILGNVITCIVISRNKTMHTATNFYLFNLAISDLLLLITGMPHDIYNYWYPDSFPFNHLVCILQGILSETAANATVLTITSFTVERYIAICHPFRQHTMSKLSRAIKFILAIWILAFCLAIPQAMQYGVVNSSPGHASCTIKTMFWQHAFVLSTFLFFIVPMSLICALYILIGVKLRKSKLLQGIKKNGCDPNNQRSSSQSRVVRMLVYVVVAFFLCWFPFHLQRLMAVYGMMTQTNNIIFRKVYKNLMYISGILYFLSTCINPLLYNIMSHKFREAFTLTLGRCGRKTDNKNNYTYSGIPRIPQNGSFKLTSAANYQKYQQQKRHSDVIIPQRDSTYCSKSNNGKHSNKYRPRYLSEDNPSTVLTTFTRYDTPRHSIERSDMKFLTNNINNNNNNNNINNFINYNNDNNIDIFENSDDPFEVEPQLQQSMVQKQQSSSSSVPVLPAPPIVSAIAEKICRKTKKVLQFKQLNNISPTILSPIPSTSSTQSTNSFCRNEDKLMKINSIDSAVTTTNTISNSSLQEVDEDEFNNNNKNNSATELVQFMDDKSVVVMTQY